jgi:uncharacterized coiled-coil DUF342 family protein
VSSERDDLSQRANALSAQLASAQADAKSTSARLESVTHERDDLLRKLSDAESKRRDSIDSATVARDQVCGGGGGGGGGGGAFLFLNKNRI